MWPLTLTIIAKILKVSNILEHWHIIRYLSDVKVSELVDVVGVQLINLWIKVTIVIRAIDWIVEIDVLAEMLLVIIEESLVCTTSSLIFLFIIFSLGSRRIWSLTIKTYNLWRLGSVFYYILNSLA